MSAAFDAWLRDTFARTRGFTALLVLVKRDRATIWPLGSSYANFIGNEMGWRDFRDMLDRSKLPWDAVVVFPAAAANGGPLPDGQARLRLKQAQDRLIEDHASINEGAFFDRKGRPLRLDPA